MKYLLFLFLFLVFFFSCSKDKPRKGLYWGEFYTTDSTGTNIVRYDHNMHVDRPTETSVTINGATLQKNGNAITGLMGFTPAFPTIPSLTVDAKWKNKGGNYRIEGEFTGFDNLFVFSGNFIMESY